MAGRMRKRTHKKGNALSNIGKGLHPPQKDNSKRAKRKAKLNNHKEEDQ